MRPLVAGGFIAASCTHSRVLVACSRRNLDARTDAVFVALDSHQFQSDPVVMSRSLVLQYPGRTIIFSHHDIKLAVVIDVSDGHAAGGPLLLEDFARFRRNIDKLLALLI